jgi:hypothetical protein
MADLDHRVSSYAASGKFQAVVPRDSLTLADLKAQIDGCPDGGAVGLPYLAYADLFPPGATDQNTHEAARKFARANGCTFENKPEANIVFFVKPKKPT